MNIDELQKDPVRAIILEWLEIVEKRDARIQELEEALGFYADKDNWLPKAMQSYTTPHMEVEKDLGRRAIKALGK